MRILYIAYSCDPLAGSEDKTGWAVPYEMAKEHEVFLVTKPEKKDHIEAFLKTHERRNIEITFVDIPKLYKQIYKGFFYSRRLSIWHRNALPMVKRIVEEHKIEIIHQITPLEMRSIGEYWNIQGVKCIYGPLGGAEYVPEGLKSYIQGNWLVELIRRMVNSKCFSRYKKKKILDHIEYLLFANQETFDYLCPLVNVNSSISTDVGIFAKEISSAYTHTMRTKVVFLCAGRLIYRKGHEFLLDAIRSIPDEYDFECRIVGGGPDFHRLKARIDKDYLLHKRVKLLGKVSFQQMAIEYDNANVLIMPSIRETTGNVLLEAQAKGLPVITIKRFGGATFLSDKNAWLYDGKTKDEYIENLAGCIRDAVDHPEIIEQKGKEALTNAHALTWEKRSSEYQKIYTMVLRESFIS